MLNYKDFTVDQANFKELVTVSANLLTQFGVETILQIDATLSAEDRGTNVWYQDALAEDALIRSTIKQTLGHKALMQKSYAGDVVFFDFFNPNATSIFNEGLMELQAQVVFRGLYIDHDEPAAFCNGEDLNGAPCGFIPVTGKEEPKSKTLLEKITDFMNFGAANRGWYTIFDDQSVESTYNLPFMPGNVNLDRDTLSLNASHPSTGFTQFDTHNLYGHTMGMAATKYWDDMEMRPMTLLRSTFPGSGKYG